MAQVMLSDTVPGTRTLGGCITVACAAAAKILAGLVTTDTGQCIEKDVYERCSSPSKVVVLAGRKLFYNNQNDSPEECLQCALGSDLLKNGGGG